MSTLHLSSRDRRQSRSASKSASKSRSRSRSSRHSYRRNNRRKEIDGQSWSDNFDSSRYGRYLSRSSNDYNGYRRSTYRRNHYNSTSYRHNGPYHIRNRENPPASNCLGIFGLSYFTREADLRDIFSEYGSIEDVQVVYDAHSCRSRGFAFVYFTSTEEAQNAKEKCNGMDVDGKKIRVDFSITQRPHTPTPGIYMGRYSQKRRKYDD